MENIIHYYAKCIELLQEEKYKRVDPSKKSGMENYNRSSL